MDTTPEVRFRRILVPAPGANQRCPLCHGQALPGQVLVACGACLTTQHRACFEETRSCTTLGCRNLRRRAAHPTDDEPDPKATEPAPQRLPMWRRWGRRGSGAMAGAVVLAGTLHLVLITLIMVSPPDAQAAENPRRLYLNFGVPSEPDVVCDDTLAPVLVRAPVEERVRQLPAGPAAAPPPKKPIPVMPALIERGLPCEWNIQRYNNGCFTDTYATHVGPCPNPQTCELPR